MPLDQETLDLVLTTFNDFAERELPLQHRLELDERDEFPEDLIRIMLGPDVGLHLVFIPEEYDGLGGGAYDIYRVSEAMARVDLGIATALLAVALGTDPIRVGGTETQKQRWMGRIAREGLIVAYGVTEPAAGSNVAALKSRAEPVEENGEIKGYRLNGTKVFITNGGVADVYTILAKAPGGPSFFVVEKGTEGLETGKSEDKHGIRASNTAQVNLDDVFVPADHLIGLEEGQGLLQASKVFAFTRLMVAAFGLGGGVAALDRAVAYSKERSQFGTLLCDMQGFTHKLIVPHAVRLEAARAYIEEVARRIDADEPDLATEGAVAKLLATEAGNAAAEAAIQAHGGYGYVKEYEVEKIKRDVRITTIYEGTSEIQQGIIAVNRWREVIKSKGRHYLDMADSAEGLDSVGNVGGGALGAALRVLSATIDHARRHRLTRQQHIQFLLADCMASVEASLALARKATRHPGDEPLAARSRLYAREVGRLIVDHATLIASGAESVTSDMLKIYGTEAGFDAVFASQAGAVADMNIVAKALKDD